MSKITQKQLVRGLIPFFGILVTCNSIFAQPTVKLLFAPDVRTIIVGGDIQEISVLARTEAPNTQFAWNLNGPGVLTGNLTSPKVLYLPPDTINGNQSYAMITVTVTDEEQREVKESIILTLVKSDYLLFKINYVYRSGGKGDFKLLTNGSMLQSGDHYKILFTPTAECYVYIFQFDSANKIYQLFPMESFGGVTVNNFNPVQAGKTYYIPAEKKSFVLDQQTGTEKIYFLSSREHDLQLEAQYQQYLDAQQQKTDLDQELSQLDRLLQHASESKGQAEIVSDPAETEKDTWQEGGQIFSVLQQRLENMCDGCVYVLTFKHE
jgi:hypothetical protein